MYEVDRTANNKHVINNFYARDQRIFFLKREHKGVLQATRVFVTLVYQRGYEHYRFKYEMFICLIDNTSPVIYLYP